MGPKKNKKGGKQGEEEDTSTQDFLTFYKKLCKELEAPISKTLDQKVNDMLDEGDNVPEMLVNERIGENGARAIAEALKKTNKGKGYKHIQSLRIWDGDIGDEGVRAFMQFVIDTNNISLSLVELLNCNIGPLGCEFISRMFEPALKANIQILTLDYNLFGNEGLNQLMLYIKDSITLKYLSLAYCGIDEQGVKHLSKYIKGNKFLERFILMGNPLKNQGILELCEYLLDNESIEEINLNNTQFGDDTDTIQKLADVMEGNKTLLIYHIKFNFVTETNFQLLLQYLTKESCRHIYQYHIDEKISKELFDKYFKAMKGRKYRPKKKGKKIVRKKKNR